MHTKKHVLIFFFRCLLYNGINYIIYAKNMVAPVAGAVESTDCTSAEK